MRSKRRRRLDWQLELRSREFVLVAALPRAVRVVRPSSYLGARGLLVLVAVKTVLYASGPWLGPRLHRWSLRVARERSAMVEELSRQLGREPTEEELYGALAAARRRRRIPPTEPVLRDGHAGTPS